MIRKVKITFISLLSGALLFFGREIPETPLSLQGSHEPIIYSAQCHDDVQGILSHNIKNAKQSIFMKVYRITDRTILYSLIENMEKNNISVTLDCHSFQRNSLPLSIQKGLEIKVNNKPKSKLMHMKILMIDESRFWIGSANFTEASLNKDSNLVVGFRSSDLASSIKMNKSMSFKVNGQQIDLNILPVDSKKALTQLISEIDQAKKFIKIAMFSFSHHKIIEALHQAYLRGISLEIIIDKNYSKLMRKSLDATGAQIPIWIKTSPHRLHHKFAWIDNKVLVFGSANWTANGFHKNDECLLFLHQLSKKQNKKLQKIWNNLSLQKENFTMLIPFVDSEKAA